MALCLPGCNSDGCADNSSALPHDGVLLIVYGHASCDGLARHRRCRCPGDSLLLRSGESVYNLYLPFRFDSGSTTFRFHYDYKAQGLDDPALDDIVTFHYTSRPFFASADCGAFYEYTVMGVEYTRHLIDSIAVTDSVITNVDRERIQVFIRTADEPETPEEGGDQ